MAANGPSPKILWGCGLICTLGLVTAIGGLVLVVPRLTTMANTAFKGMLAREEQWAALARSWRPLPRDAGPDRLFPARVGAFTRTACDRAAAPDLGISDVGAHAVYRSNQGPVEVFVYHATELEKEALFRRVAEALENMRATYRTTLGSWKNSRLRYSLGGPDQQGALWWSQGWLFLARTHGPAEAEAFLRSYLETTSDSAHGRVPAASSR